MPGSPESDTAMPSRFARARWAIPVLLGVTLIARLAALSVASEARLAPDEAHVLNVARCIERGQGFSNPAAWPAWLQPASLPMPESFREPGYPYAVAWLTPEGGDLYQTARWISFVAGLLLPLLIYRLARNMELDARVALLAGLLCAASPVLIMHSVQAVVQSLFATTIAAVFVAGTWPLTSKGLRAPWLQAAAVGGLFGLAYLMRAQALMAVPAVIAVLWIGRSWSARLRGAALATLAFVVVASPFLLRNLDEFGTPFYSNVASMAVLPYVDRLTVYNGIERPPNAFEYAVSHVPQVLAYMARSVSRFMTSLIPTNLLGHPLWLVPLAAGVLLTFSNWRRWVFVYLYVLVTFGFISAVHWAAYYFTSVTPYLCLLAAVGAGWFAQQLSGARLAPGVTPPRLLWAALAVTLAVQVAWSRREVSRYHFAEIDAARSEAAFLKRELAPDEAVMALTTSYWAWFADRPTVGFTVADEKRFSEVLERYKVRFVTLPTDRVEVFAARFPDGRLPGVLELSHADDVVNISVFRVAGGR